MNHLSSKNLRILEEYLLLRTIRACTSGSSMSRYLFLKRCSSSASQWNLSGRGLIDFVSNWSLLMRIVGIPLWFLKAVPPNQTKSQTSIYWSKTSNTVYSFPCMVIVSWIHHFPSKREVGVSLEMTHWIFPDWSRISKNVMAPWRLLDTILPASAMLLIHSFPRSVKFLGTNVSTFFATQRAWVVLPNLSGKQMIPALWRSSAFCARFFSILVSVSSIVILRVTK